MAQRTYRQLKKSVSEDRFDAYCAKIATRYANSDGQFSSTYFSREENITTDCFYLLLRDAIIKNLVDDKTVDMMEYKAMSNQKRHCEKAGETSRVKYKKLREKRTQYIISQLSDNEISNITINYAYDERLTIDDLTQMYDLSESVIKNVIKKAFIEGMIEDEVCRMLEEKALNKASDQRYVKTFFKSLWEQRKKQESREKSS